MTKFNGVDVDVDQARLNNKVGRKTKPRVWRKPMRESFRPLILSAIKLFPDDRPAESPPPPSTSWIHNLIHHHNLVHYLKATLRATLLPPFLPSPSPLLPLHSIARSILRLMPQGRTPLPQCKWCWNAQTYCHKSQDRVAPAIAEKVVSSEPGSTAYDRIQTQVCRTCCSQKEESQTRRNFAVAQQPQSHWQHIVCSSQSGRLSCIGSQYRHQPQRLQCQCRA